MQCASLLHDTGLFASAPLATGAKVRDAVVIAPPDERYAAQARAAHFPPVHGLLAWLVFSGAHAPHARIIPQGLDE